MISPTMFIGVGVNGREACMKSYEITAASCSSNLPFHMFCGCPTQKDELESQSLYPYEALLRDEQHGGGLGIASLWNRLRSSEQYIRSRDVKRSEESYFLVGDINEKEVLNLMEALIKEIGLETVTTVSKRVEVFMMLRSGEIGSDVKTMAKSRIIELIQMLGVRGRLFILDSTNSAGIAFLTEGQVEQIGKILFLRANTELVQIGGMEDQAIIDSNCAACFSMGVSDISFPARKILDEKLFECTRAMYFCAINGYRRSSDETSIARARGFLSRCGIGPNGDFNKTTSKIRHLLDINEEGASQASLKEEINIDRFRFSSEHLTDIPMTLSNFHIFMCESRLDKIIKKLENNRVSSSKVIIEEMRTELDQIVSSDWNTDGAHLFLKEISSAIQNFKSKYPYTRIETASGISDDVKKQLDMGSSFKNLARKISSIPLPISIAIKSALAGLAATPLVFGLLSLLLGRMGIGLETSLIKGAVLLGSFFLPSIISLGLGMLTYNQAIKGSEALIEDCINQMKSKYLQFYEAAIESSTISVANTLYLLVCSKDAIQEADKELAEINEETRLRNYDSERREIEALLEKSKFEADDINGLPVSSYIRSTITTNYKKSREIDWAFEIDQLLTSGFTNNWREETKDGMLQKLLEYVRRGLSYIGDYTLEDYLKESEASDQEIRRLTDQVNLRKAPMLCLNGYFDTEKENAYTACNGSENNAFIKLCVRYNKQHNLGRIMEIEDKNSIYFANIRKYTKPEEVIEMLFNCAR